MHRRFRKTGKQYRYESDAFHYNAGACCCVSWYYEHFRFIWFVCDFERMFYGTWNCNYHIRFYIGKEKYKQDCEERITKYNSYIDKKKEEIEIKRREEAESLRDTYCDIGVDVDTAMNFDRRLFEKRGKTKISFGFILVREVLILHGRSIIKSRNVWRLEMNLRICQKICEMYLKIDHAPVYTDFKNANAVGVVGAKKALYAMFKNIVIDVSVRHYYGDVRLFLLVDDEKQYEWVRMLPHLGNDKGTRNIVCNNESKNNLFENLFRELNYREQTKIFHITVWFSWKMNLESKTIRFQDILRMRQNWE